MNLKDYWNPICIAISVGMAAIIIALSYPLFFLLDSDMPRATTFIACHYAGMVLCLILFVSVLLDRRISDATYFFMCLISFEFLSLMLEFLFWHVNTYRHSDLVLSIIYYSEDMMFPIILYVFGNYERCILDLDRNTFSKINLVLVGGLGLQVALLIINLFTNCMFDVSNGAYVYNSMFLVQYIPPLSMALACLYVAYHYATNRRHKFTLMIYILIPIVTVIAKLPHYSSSVTYLATLITFIFMYGEIYLDRGIKIVKNEAAMTEQRIAMMISRIEPAFLEESLISIANMEGNPPETKGAIEDFMKYLGENVGTISEKKPISLDQELGHVETYINLEKLRFKEKLNVSFDVRDRNFKIPAMTLQMMVENAIKHGITQRENGGTVTIITRETGDWHIVQVIDDGVGFDPDSPKSGNRSHIGLNSISARLEEMLDGKFEIESTIGVGTTATAYIPKKD